MGRQWPAKLFTQNCRGAKTFDQMTILFNQMVKRRAFATFLQETWRIGDEEFMQGSQLFVGCGPCVQVGRGSQGVGIMLGRSATAGWKLGGSIVHRISPRVLALPISANDTLSRAKLGIYLITAYAPTSDKSAAEWDQYYTELSLAISLKPTGYVLVAGFDANASVGIGDSVCSSGYGTASIGPYGVDWLNDAGRRFRSFLSLNELASLATFFRKPYYSSWMHPRSNRLYQIDHIIISRCDLKRFTDCGSCRGQLLDSDHRAVGCKMRMKVIIQKRADVRAKIIKLDYTPLRNDMEKQVTYASNVVKRLGRRIPGADGDAGQLWPGQIRKDGSVQPTSHDTYDLLVKAMIAEAHASLETQVRSNPDWYEAKAPELEKLTAERDHALGGCRAGTPGEREALTLARSKLQAATRRAKSDWIMAKVTKVNANIVSARGTKVAWDVVKELKAGLQGVSRMGAPAMMKRANGTKATSAEENAAIFAEGFQELYGRVATFDGKVLDLLPQRPVAMDLERRPDDGDISRAMARLHETGPGISGLGACLWHSLESTVEGFALVREVTLDFWDSLQTPKAWDSGLLKILFKKGDKCLRDNYRGIMLLEVAYKIVAYIILFRLEIIKASPVHLDHESQCGFIRGRGTADASFTIKQLIRKRREHGLESWLLLIDLVKAFDRVPRELLWLTLLRQGVPPKLVDLLKALHASVLVHFEVDGVSRTLQSIIGVKQGDVLGSELFTFFMAAIMETWQMDSTYELCLFRTRPDFVLSGRRPMAKGEEFTVVDSRYADDTGLAFCSRADVDLQTPRVITHFGKWGMEIHSGILDTSDPMAMVETKASKSEILFCSAPPSSYTDPLTFDGANLGRLLLPGNRFMPIVDRFPYLGDIISRDGGDSLAVDSRIVTAGKAFGALRGCIFSSTSVSHQAKKAVYEAVVLALLLFGCESWSLPQILMQHMRVFHAQCLRAMLRISRVHTWQHSISTQQLQHDLGLESIDTYVARRQLRWLGHVSRMDHGVRLPRRMLSCWVPHARPGGAPKMTYGRSIRNALELFHIDEGVWHGLAADRGAWRDTLRKGIPPPEFQASSVHSKNTMVQGVAMAVAMGVAVAVVPAGIAMVMAIPATKAMATGLPTGNAMPMAFPVCRIN